MKGSLPSSSRRFFPHLNPDDFAGFARLSPKILLVAPGKRLSWQYHHRRSEIWKLIGGKAAVVVSDTDAQMPERNLVPGDLVSLRQGGAPPAGGYNRVGYRC